jgi:hypothetical protein
MVTPMTTAKEKENISLEAVNGVQMRIYKTSTAHAWKSKMHTE